MSDKPPLTPERMQILICVSNRLLMALGMLMALLIPGALLTYWFGAVIVGGFDRYFSSLNIKSTSAASVSWGCRSA